MDDEGRSEIADLAIDVAREAGALLLAGHGRVRSVGTKSSPQDLVTQMDREAEALIRRRIAEHRPDDRILGEEQGWGVGAEEPAEPGPGVRWVVDPLDGTVNYFYGLPAWGVSVAAEVAGRILVGVVVVPALGEEYVAVSGSGSHRRVAGRAEPLAVSTVSELDHALVATGFGYLRERRAEQGRVVAGLLPDVRDIRRCGAAAVDLCWVAAGRLDAHYESGLHRWDWAAGSLIVAEAGGVVAGLNGAPAGDAMVLAAPPRLFTRLHDRLVELDADHPI